MNKEKNSLLISILVMVVALGAVSVWLNARYSSGALNTANAEGTVATLVQNWGMTLKNVSLLSPTVAADLDKNYKNFVYPPLLSQWKADPTKAVGRLTSSPWPDRIEVSSVSQNQNGGGYDVKGYVVEVTSDNQAGIKHPIELGVSKYNGQWMIVGVNLGN